MDAAGLTLSPLTSSAHIPAAPGRLTRWFGGRAGVFTVAAMVSVTLLAARTAQLTVISEASVIAKEDRRALPAQRGDLLDRSGLPLAITEQVSNVYIDSLGVQQERQRTSGKAKATLEQKLEKLRSGLGISSVDFEKKLAVKSHWVQIGRKIDAISTQKLRDLSMYLLTIEDQPRRIYPDASVARGIVGRAQVGNPVTADGLRWSSLTGKSGLELDLDSLLVGQPGELLTERGPGGREIPSENRRLIPATKGTSFYLTIDRALQYRTDEMLRQAIITYGAKAGYIGVMQTKTGDILASSAQEVDLTTGEVKQKLFNAGIGEAYEPGSTMKPFTMATALDTGVVSADDRFNISDRLTMQWTRNGKVTDKKIFKDDTSHDPKYWNIHDMLVNSSNIGTITVARKLEKEGLYNGLKGFGFGEYTNLASRKIETRGVMKDTKDWSGVDIGTVAIGQGVSVTPIQMLSALNTLAADGEYISPRLVQSELSATGQRVSRPVNKRRVVSSETASTLRSYMQDVVADGTGKRAYVDGYAVAGKTGTAQKAEKGTYAEKAYIASFGGFYPAQAPEITMIVILDEPWAEYGGMTAAPVFADMVRLTAQRYRIAPVSDEGQSRRTTQVLATPELRAVNDPASKGSAPASLPSQSGPMTSTSTGSPSRSTVKVASAEQPGEVEKTQSTSETVDSQKKTAAVSKETTSSTPVAPKRARKTTPSASTSAREVVEPADSVQREPISTVKSPTAKTVEVGEQEAKVDDKVGTKSDTVTGLSQ
jgi:cell division protein FtsI/penicillin-binding protein 2